MGTDGVVDLFPVAQLTVSFFHLQRPSRDLVELLGVGTLGAFDRAVELGRAQGQHEQAQAALLSGLFELGAELAPAIDPAAREWEKGCGATTCRGTRAAAWGRARV
jgi:hypothetical protein